MAKHRDNSVSFGLREAKGPGGWQAFRRDADGETVLTPLLKVSVHGNKWVDVPGYDADKKPLTEDVEVDGKLVTRPKLVRVLGYEQVDTKRVQSETKASALARVMTAIREEWLSSSTARRAGA